MINKIGNVNDVTTLGEITEPGKTPAYFLSMLQLVGFEMNIFFNEHFLMIPSFQINNRNVEIDFGERTMTEPVDIGNIKIKLKSRILHREKFDEMGQQFVLEEAKKVGQKRKAVQTSTPAKHRKRVSLELGEFSLDSPNVMSQCSSGYFSQSSMLSQSSTLSDC